MGYTRHMKTAISIPDSIFQAAEGLAKRMGISRSELYAKAVAEYTKTHKSTNVTEQLNSVYDQQISKIDKELVTMQNQSIDEKW